MNDCNLKLWIFNTILAHGTMRLYHVYRPFNGIPQNSCFRHVCKINNMCTKLFEWEGGSKGLQGNKLTAHIFSYEKTFCFTPSKYLQDLSASPPLIHHPQYEIWIEGRKEGCSHTQDMPCRLLYQWVVVKRQQIRQVLESIFHAETLQHHLQTQSVAKLNVTADKLLSVHFAIKIGRRNTLLLVSKDHGKIKHGNIAYSK